jgi:hypothetical protein
VVLGRAAAATLAPMVGRQLDAGLAAHAGDQCLVYTYRPLLPGDTCATIVVDPSCPP